MKVLAGALDIDRLGIVQLESSKYESPCSGTELEKELGTEPEIGLEIDLSEASLQKRIDFIKKISKNCIEFVRQEQQKKTKQDWSVLMALAFFLRRANLEKICSDARFRLPKKQRLIFHVLPNNAVTMALFTWVLAHLMGHRSVVRISSRDNPVTQRFIEAINALEADETHKDEFKRLSFINYPHQQDLNIALSTRADMRIIWGGDKAIAAFESIATVGNTTSAKGQSIQFPSRQSIAIIEANAAIKDNSMCMDTIKQWAAEFVVDHLPFNQQACSSAKAVFWIQSNLSNEVLGKIQNAFWSNVSEAAEQARFYSGEDYAVERLIWRQSTMLSQKTVSIFDSNQISVLQVQSMSQDHYVENHGFGCFYQMNVASIESVEDYKPDNLQTIAVAGIDDSAIIHAINTQLGGKRAVLFGQCLALDTTWDGTDLIEIMANHSD